MSIYIGVDGKARRVKSAYMGVNGKAQIVYTGSDVPSTYVPYTYIYRTNYQYAQMEESINTNTFTQIICDFKLASTNGHGVYNNKDQTFYEGIFYTTGTTAYIEFRTDSKAYCVIKKGQHSWTSSALTAETLYTINLTKNTNGDCYFGSTKIFSDVDTSSTGTAIQSIGRPHGATSNSFEFYVQAYSKIYLKGLVGYDLLNQNYLFDYRPCIKSDGSSVGLYNKINGNFINQYSSYYMCTN